jgi:hypothetical protein
MADPPPYPDTGNDTGVGPDRESTSSHPGADDTARQREPATTGSWASKLVIAIVAALVVLIVILHLTGVVGPGAH